MIWQLLTRNMMRKRPITLPVGESIGGVMGFFISSGLKAFHMAQLDDNKQ